MNIATLEIEFMAEISRLRQDMNEVRNMTTQTQNVVAGAADGMKKALGGIVAGVSVAAFGAWMKSAIDAGDSMKAFSQKTGVAVEEVAGLQLAFQQGGVESDKLQGAIAKMAKQIAEGGEGFKNLGVETRNADGTLRNAKDVLYDVADATKKMGDGAQKTTALQDIFGKSASDLIPTLNEGSEGMRTMADMAEKLGLAMSAEAADEADKFNDTIELLGESTKGMARQVMSELLPTLNSLAGSMLEGATQGNTLKNIATGIAIVFKSLYTVFAVVTEYVTQVGKNFGAVTAMIVAAMAGDFAGAMTIAKERAQDMTDDVSARAKSLGNVWSDTGGETVAALAAVNAKSKDVVTQTKGQNVVVDASAKVYSSFTEKLTATRNELQGQISSGEKLTKTQQVLVELTSNNTAEVKKLSEAARQHLMVEAQKNIALEQSAIALDGSRKAAEKLRAELDKKNESLDSEIQKQLESNAKLRDGEGASAALEVAKLREAAATAQKNAVTAQEIQHDSVLAGEYQKQADKLLELADLKGQGVHLEMAKQANEEWKKTTDSIENGLTDSLMRAFESGKGFGQAFKDTLVNTFKTMILKPTLQAVVGGVFGGGSMAAAASGAAGSAGAGAGAGGILGGVASLIGMGKAAYSFLSGGALTSLSNGIVSLGAKLGSAGLQDFGGSMVGGVSPFATSTTASTMGSYAGTALGYLGGIGIGQFAGRAISGGYAVGGGQSGSSAVNVGTLAGAIFGGPIGAAIGGAVGGLVNRAFGMSAKNVKERGIEGSFSAGDVAGQNYANWNQKGGWFRSDKNGVDRTDFDSATDDALSSGAMAVYEQTKVWADALKLPAERLASVTTSFKVALGDNSGANQQAVTKLFTDYQNSLASRFSGALREFQKAGESLADTMNRLAGLQLFSAAFNEFGGVFSRIASLSVDAREQLIGFAGGIDALIGKTQSFVDAYYSDAEKFGLQSKQVAGALKDLGVDPASLQTRDQYRALVEQQNIETESGRKMFAALLDVAPAFAGLAEYLTQNNMTLEQSAKQAPQTALLEALFDQSKLSANDMVDQQVLANDNLMSIEGAIRSGNQAVIDAITASGGVMNEAVSRALSSYRDSASRAIVAA